MGKARIHFLTESVQDPHNGDINYSIGALVSPGDPLITLATEVPAETGGEEKETRVPAPSQPVDGTVTFEAGDGAEVDILEEQIRANRFGYPTLSNRSGDEVQLQVVSVTPLITLSEDKMEAFITLLPPLAGKDVAVSEILDAAMAQLGIVYGVDYRLIENSCKEVKQTMIPIFHRTIARGRAPLHGQDAYLRYSVEIGVIPGKILASGDIDFRERRMFVGVDSGETIATKVPRSKGNDGINVLGERVPAIEGKDIQVKVSDDAVFNDETGQITALSSGVVSVVKDSTIRVTAKQKIEGNVDYSTGNIRSQNGVEIAGSVYPEFRVSVRGDLHIGENVQSARVYTSGNLTVKGGIIGPGSSVRVSGDAELNYIERGELQAGGNVVIRSSSYYSNLLIEGNLHCPENVKIIGGKVVVGGSFSTGQVGAEKAEPLLLAAGTDPKKLQLHEQLTIEHFELSQELQSVVRRHGKNLPHDRVENLEAEIQELEEELQNLNLTSRNSMTTDGTDQTTVCSAEITVFGSISSGTTVRLGNEVMELKQDYRKVKIYLNQSTQKIVIENL